jgi:hypothetical protein
VDYIDTTPQNTHSKAVTGLLLIVLGVVGVFFCGAVYISLFQYDACLGNCDYTMGNWALYGMFGVAVLAIVLSIVISVSLHRRNRSSWHVPVVGLAVEGVAFFVALVLVSVGSA